MVSPGGASPAVIVHLYVSGEMVSDIIEHLDKKDFFVTFILKVTFFQDSWQLFAICPNYMTAPHSGVAGRRLGCCNCTFVCQRGNGVRHYSASWKNAFFLTLSFQNKLFFLNFWQLFVICPNFTTAPHSSVARRRLACCNCTFVCQRGNGVRHYSASWCERQKRKPDIVC